MSNSLNKEDYLGWEDQELYNQWWNESEARRRETTYVELSNTPIPDTKAKPVYLTGSTNRIKVVNVLFYFIWLRVIIGSPKQTLH